MKFKLFLPALLLMASPVFAADIDGTWTGSVDSPNGAVQVKFTFKAEAAKLTGSVVGPDGTPAPISMGTVSGNQITFSQEVDLGGMKITFVWTGEVAKDKLSLTTSFMDMPIAIMLTKT
jgi:hypothetical protein